MGSALWFGAIVVLGARGFNPFGVCRTLALQRSPLATVGFSKLGEAFDEMRTSAYLSHLLEL